MTTTVDGLVAVHDELQGEPDHHGPQEDDPKGPVLDYAEPERAFFLGTMSSLSLGSVIT